MTRMMSCMDIFVCLLPLGLCVQCCFCAGNRQPAAPVWSHCWHPSQYKLLCLKCDQTVPLLTPCTCTDTGGQKWDNIVKLNWTQLESCYNDNNHDIRCLHTTYTPYNKTPNHFFHLSDIKLDQVFPVCFLFVKITKNTYF